LYLIEPVFFLVLFHPLKEGGDLCPAFGDGVKRAMDT
jgi:hypothetical protein